MLRFIILSLAILFNIGSLSAQTKRYLFNDINLAVRHAKKVVALEISSKDLDKFNKHIHKFENLETLTIDPNYATRYSSIPNELYDTLTQFDIVLEQLPKLKDITLFNIKLPSITLPKGKENNTLRSVNLHDCELDELIGLETSYPNLNEFIFRESSVENIDWEEFKALELEYVYIDNSYGNNELINLKELIPEYYIYTDINEALKEPHNVYNLDLAMMNAEDTASLQNIKQFSNLQHFALPSCMHYFPADLMEMTSIEGIYTGFGINPYFTSMNMDWFDDDAWDELTSPKLIEIPEEISNLHNLRKLSLAYLTRVKIIPTTVKELEQLEYVNLGYHNHIENVNILAELPNLVALELAEESFEQYPILEQWKLGYEEYDYHFYGKRGKSIFR